MAPDAGQDQLAPRTYLRILALAALLGIPAALAAALFLALVHELEGWLWDDLPDALGHSGPPWYLVIGLPVAGALVVAGARRFLPGDGGKRPIEGLGAEATPVSHIPGVVLAALGTLGFGAVLGPEAPVIALGSATAALVTYRARLHDARERAVVAQSGSTSAMSALFGGPLVAGILLLEAGIGLGPAVVPVLIPGFLAAAVGYTLFVGFGHFGGLDTPGLAEPGLPAYDGIHPGDLLLAVAVGVLTVLAVRTARRLAMAVEGVGPRVGVTGLLLAGGLAVGLLAQAGNWLGADSQDVLFSGQASVPAVVKEGSVGIVLVLLVAKLLAYAVSLGCGYRGGPIFPAIFLGVAIASVAVATVDSSPTWAVAVGATAGMAAQAHLIVAALLFGSLLVGPTGADAVPAAVLAGVAAWLTATALDRRAAAATAAADNAPAGPTPDPGAASAPGPDPDRDAEPGPSPGPGPDPDRDAEPGPGAHPDQRPGAESGPAT